MGLDLGVLILDLGVLILDLGVLILGEPCVPI